MRTIVRDDRDDSSPRTSERRTKLYHLYVHDGSKMSRAWVPERKLIPTAKMVKNVDETNMMVRINAVQEPSDQTGLWMWFEESGQSPESKKHSPHRLSPTKGPTAPSDSRHQPQFRDTRIQRLAWSVQAHS